MLSEWSQCILTGAPRLLFTRPKTIGARNAAAIGKISCIRATPFALEAVITLAPDTEAPTHAVIAECSLSTATYSESTWPFATNSANFTGISVEGVIGYAATTSGLTCLIASAKARLPDVISFLLFNMICHLPRVFAVFSLFACKICFLVHGDRIHGTYLRTYAAPLAEEHVDAAYTSLFIGLYGGIRTLKPAFQAGYALVLVKHWTHASPKACLHVKSRRSPCYSRRRNILPAFRFAHARTASSRPRRIALRFASRTGPGSCFIFFVK